MTTCSTFSEFAAQVRELIHSSERETHNAEPGIEPAPRVNGCEFNQLALELFALQFAHNAPYRRFCQARSALPESITHWQNIPAIPAAAFKESELTCLPPSERTVVFHSSGTTPSRHFHNPESLALYEASLLPWFRTHLLGMPPRDHSPAGLKMILLTPPPDEAPHSSLAHMFETVRCKFGSADSLFVGHVTSDGAWIMDFEEALRSLRDSPHRPVALLGTAFGFVHLLDHLAAGRIDLAAGSRVLETGGYKGRSRELPKAELHALITERFGVPPTHIVCEYGMSELSSQAYDRIAGRNANAQHSTLNAQHGFHFPPWARAQIISPETGSEVGEGETGLIRVFDLANVWSVMALQTEDLGIRRGDGFEIIGRVKNAEPRGCSLMTG